MPTSIQNAMRLAALGDAIGAPVEFPYSGETPTKAAALDHALTAATLNVTDDTQLALHLLANAKNGKLNENDVLHALADYYNDPACHEPQRAPGGAVMAGAHEAATTGRAHDDTLGQFGSGAVMRTPVFAFLGQRDLAARTAHYTHAHPLSVLSVEWVYDLCADPSLPLPPELAADEWGGFSAAGVCQDVRRALDVTEGLSQADALKRAVLIGRDADTVGFILGAILGWNTPWDGTCNDWWDRLEPVYAQAIDALPA
ncbi:MAG: ADP-ribosylglycohydrolase family protein [Actinomycetaceae bacterium]|nr:ADP-ribosylglycohydrolase family protein [Actinomycetaceae bacterium]